MRDAFRHVADRITVRHAMTFLVGLAGLAALLPLGRLVGGRWVGLTAIVLCLMTGYVYGSLFFTPIDVPFLAAMTWATLAIAVMARQVLPSWPSTLAAGVLTGLLSPPAPVGSSLTRICSVRCCCARRNPSP